MHGLLCYQPTPASAASASAAAAAAPSPVPHAAAAAASHEPAGSAAAAAAASADDDGVESADEDEDDDGNGRQVAPKKILGGSADEEAEAGKGMGATRSFVGAIVAPSNANAAATNKEAPAKGLELESVTHGK